MTTDGDDFVEMDQRYRAAAAAGAVDEFVREMAARPAFAAWLDDDAIPCDAFFACADVAQRRGWWPRLREERAVALAWFDQAALILRSAPSSGGDNAPVVMALNRIEMPARDAVAAFLLRNTRAAHFHGAAHQGLFLWAFCGAGSAKGIEAVAAARFAEQPEWFMDYMTRSSIARVMGPRFIGVVLRAAEGAEPPPRGVAAALEVLTGLPQAPDTVLYIRQVAAWYAEHRDALVINPMAIYPAPLMRPTFLRPQPARPPGSPT